MAASDPRITLTVWGSAELSELPTLAGIGDNENADLTHMMDPGDSVTLDTEPPIRIEVRSA